MQNASQIQNATGQIGPGLNAGMHDPGQPMSHLSSPYGMQHGYNPVQQYSGFYDPEMQLFQQSNQPAIGGYSSNVPTYGVVQPIQGLPGASQGIQGTPMQPIMSSGSNYPGFHRTPSFVPMQQYPSIMTPQPLARQLSAATTYLPPGSDLSTLPQGGPSAVPFSGSSPYQRQRTMLPTGTSDASAGFGGMGSGIPGGFATIPSVGDSGSGIGVPSSSGTGRSGSGPNDQSELIAQLRRLNNDLSTQLALRESRIQELQEQSAAGRLQQQLQGHLEQLRSQKKIIDEYEAKMANQQQLAQQVEELNISLRSLSKKLESERQAHEATQSDLVQKCEEQSADIEVLESKLAEQFIATQSAQDELKKVASQNTLLQRALDAERVENAKLARATGVESLQNRLDEVSRLLKDSNMENSKLKEQLLEANATLQDSQHATSLLTRQMQEGREQATNEALILLAQRTDEIKQLKQQLRDGNLLIENLRKQTAQSEYDLLAVRDRLAESELTQQKFDGFGESMGSDALKELRRLRIVLRERDVQIATHATSQTKMAKALNACKFENDELRRKLGMKPAGEDGAEPAWDEERAELELNVQLQSCKALVLKQERQINRLERERLELLKELREGAITDARGFLEFLGLTAEQTELVKAYAQNVLEGEPEKLPDSLRQDFTSRTMPKENYGSISSISLLAAQEEIANLKNEISSWKFNHASALVAKDQLEDRLKEIEAERSSKFEEILVAVRQIQAQNSQQQPVSTIALESMVRAELSKSGKPVTRNESKLPGFASRGIKIDTKMQNTFTESVEHKEEEMEEKKEAEVIRIRTVAVSGDVKQDTPEMRNNLLYTPDVEAALKSADLPEELKTYVDSLMKNLSRRDVEMSRLYMVNDQLSKHRRELEEKLNDVNQKRMLECKRYEESIENFRITQQSAADVRDAILAAAVKLGVDVSQLKSSGIFDLRSITNSKEANGKGEESFVPILKDNHQFSTLANALDSWDDNASLEDTLQNSLSRDDLVREVMLLQLQHKSLKRREKFLKVSMIMLEQRFDAFSRLSLEQEHEMKIQLADAQQVRSKAEARCLNAEKALAHSVPIYEATVIGQQAIIARKREVAAISELATSQILASRTRTAEAELHEQARLLAEARDVISTNKMRIAKLEATVAGTVSGTSASLSVVIAALEEERELLQKRLVRAEDSLQQANIRAREVESESDILSERVKSLNATVRAEQNEVLMLRTKMNGAITVNEAKKLKDAESDALQRVAEVEAEIDNARERCAAANAFAKKILEFPFVSALRESFIRYENISRNEKSGDIDYEEITQPLLKEFMSLKESVKLLAESSDSGCETAAMQQKLAQTAIAHGESIKARMQVEEALSRCQAELLKLKNEKEESQAIIASLSQKIRSRAGAVLLSDAQRDLDEYNEGPRKIRELISENIRANNRAEIAERLSSEAREKMIKTEAKLEQLQAEIDHYQELISTIQQTKSIEDENLDELKGSNPEEYEAKLRSKVLEWGELARAAKVLQLQHEHRIRMLESELKVAHKMTQESEEALKTSQIRVVELETILESAGSDHARLNREVEKLSAQANLKKAMDRLDSQDPEEKSNASLQNSSQIASRGVVLPVSENGDKKIAQQNSQAWSSSASVGRALQQMKTDMQEGQKVIEQQTEHLQLLARELESARRESERVKAQCSAEVELAEATKAQAIQSLKRALVATEAQLEAKTQAAENYKDMIQKQRERFETQRKSDHAEIDRLSDLLYQTSENNGDIGTRGIGLNSKNTLEKLQAYLKEVPKLPEGVVLTEDVEKLISERDAIIQDLTNKLEAMERRIENADDKRDEESEKKLLATMEEMGNAKARVVELETQLSALTHADETTHALKLKEVVEQMRRALKSKDQRLEYLAETINSLQKRLIDHGISDISIYSPKIEQLASSTDLIMSPQLAGQPKPIDESDTMKALHILKETVQQYAERVASLEKDVRVKKSELEAAYSNADSLKRLKAEDEVKIKEIESRAIKLAQENTRLHTLLNRSRQRVPSGASVTNVSDQPPLGSAFSPENNHILRIRTLELQNRKLKQELKAKSDSTSSQKSPTSEPIDELKEKPEIDQASSQAQQDQVKALSKQTENLRAKHVEQKLEIQRLNAEVAKLIEEKKALVKEQNDLTVKLRLKRPNAIPNTDANDLKGQKLLELKERTLLESAQAQQRLLEEKTRAENNILDLVRVLEGCRHREDVLKGEISNLRKLLEDKDKELIALNTQVLMSAKSAAALTRVKAEVDGPNASSAQLAEAAEAAEVQAVATTHLIAQLQQVAERERQSADELQQKLFDAEHQIRSYALEQQRKSQEVTVLEQRLQDLAQVISTYEAGLGTDPSSDSSDSTRLETASQSLAKLVEKQKREIDSLRDQVERLQQLSAGGRTASDPSTAIRKLQDKMKELDSERIAALTELKKVRDEATQEQLRQKNLIKDSRGKLRKEEEAHKLTKEKLVEALQNAENIESELEVCKQKLKSFTDEDSVRTRDAELELQQERQRIERMRAEISLLRTQFESAVNELAELQEDCKAKESQIKKLNEAVNSHEQAEEEYIELKKTLEDLHSKNEELEMELSVYNDDFFSEIKQLRDKYVQAVKALQEADETIARYQQLNRAMTPGLTDVAIPSSNSTVAASNALGRY